MHAFFRHEKEIKAQLDEAGIENFLPMRYIEQFVHGKKQRVQVPAVSNLIFVRSTQAELAPLMERNYCFRFIYGKGGQYSGILTVPDDQMRNFILVAGSNDERLIYLKPQELNLSRGQRVRIRGGVFDGVEGLFLKVKGARSKRIVVRLENFMAVAAEVQPEFVEVIE